MAIAKRIIVDIGNDTISIYKQTERPNRRTELIFEGKEPYIPLYLLKEMQYSQIKFNYNY